jgi:hypothetical protein
MDSLERGKQNTWAVPWVRLESSFWFEVAFTYLQCCLHVWEQVAICCCLFAPVHPQHYYIVKVLVTEISDTHWNTMQCPVQTVLLEISLNILQHSCSRRDRDKSCHLLTPAAT